MVIVVQLVQMLISMYRFQFSLRLKPFWFLSGNVHLMKYDKVSEL